MPKVNCIIIEDEKPAQEVLKSYVAKTEWVVLKATFEDAISAMEFLKNNDVDLMFLDIQIPSLSGIDFLKILKNAPQVIITTAYSEFALDAFELDVRDYLKKPFSFDRYLKAINRIAIQPDPSQVHHLEKGTHAEQSFAFFNVNKTMVKVMFRHIRYVESMREYVYIHSDDEKIVTKMGIGEFEKLLPGYFLRTHRSYVVNTDKITAYNAEEIFVGKTSIPIGTNYKKQIWSVLGKGNESQQISS